MSESFYSAQEADAAANTIPHIVKAINLENLNHAQQLIDAVLSHFPDDYRYSYENEKNEKCIKFWDHEEFFYYVSRHKDQSVVWNLNAYGKAYYYRGFLCIEQGNYFDALQWLDKGLAIEPDQTLFRLEKAKVFSALKQPEAATEEYQAILSRAEEVVPTSRAAAMRGLGFHRIEENRLDEAEQLFRESLGINPNSEIAQHELAYIQHLRTGGQSVSGSMTTTTPDIDMMCALCQKPMREGTLLNVQDQLVYVCNSCQNKPEKKWWQFWRR
jgi:tetratricopeptide (TPR) repeat protein